MTRITYIEASGARHAVEIPNGFSLMQGALNNNIDSINGECGGGLACATCHVHIDEGWIEKTGVANDMEIEMLDYAVSDRRPNSRLACQIQVRDELDGLIVWLPAPQANQ